MYITYNAILQGFLHIHCIHRVVLTDLRVPALQLLSPTQGSREGQDGKVKKKKKRERKLENIIPSSKHCVDIYPKIAKRKVVFGIVGFFLLLFFLFFFLQRCFQLFFFFFFFLNTVVFWHKTK